ncbi:MAG: LuxR C-terminal-related transcriptional regulator [Crocinitomicaceae bacterium]
MEFQKSFTLDSALAHHKKAFELLVLEMPRHQETAISLNKIGIVYIYSGSFLEAVYYLKGSTQIFEDGILKANSLNNLAIAHKYLGEVDEAIVNYQEAFKLYMDFQAYDKALDVELNIASLHLNQENDSIALIYLKETEKIAQEKQLDEQFYRSRCNQANILRRNGEFDKAIELYKEAEEYFRKESLISFRISNLNNLAIAYGDIKQVRKEIEIYNLLITITTENQLYSMLSAVKANLGSAYLIEGKHTLAESNLLEALDLATQLNTTEYLPSIYKSLSEVYKAKNDNGQALYYAEKELQLRDSLLEVERLSSLLESESKMKTQQYSDSLSQAKEDIQKKNNDISKKGRAITKVFWFIAILFPMVLITSFLYIKKRRKNRNLIVEVDKKQKDILSLNDQIQDKEGIIKSIEKTSKKPYPANLEVLTEREKQVLLLLAEGHSDQEIAEELHLSPATIRTHLRKAYVKIDVKNRAQATQFVMAHNI